MPSAFLDLHRAEVEKGWIGDKLVQYKAKRAAKGKGKRVNFALRPLKSMNVLMGVAKSMDEECECEECEEKEIKCSECPKCSKKVGKALSKDQIASLNPRERAAIKTDPEMRKLIDFENNGYTNPQTGERTPSMWKQAGVKPPWAKPRQRKPVAKGVYSESIEGIQRDRQKANRRRAAGNAFLGGSALAGTAALANREMTKDVVRETGRAMTVPRANMEARALQSGGGKIPRATTVRAIDALASAGNKVAAHPGRAAAGVILGAAAAGGGLKAAGMAHNARSNRNARKYNKRKANSRIKVVPTSGKNRF